jgi:hypothetical protein
MKRVLTFAALTCTLVGRVDAQACLGRASFASGVYRAGLTYQDPDAYGGQFAYGTVHSGFVAADLTAIRPAELPSGASSSSTRIGGTVGSQITVSQRARAEFCPTFGIGMAFGSSEFPNRSSDFRTRNIDLGFTFGMATGPAEELHFIPSAGVKYAFEGTSGTSTSNGVSVKYTTQTSATGYWVLALGVARGTITVTPLTYVPIGSTSRKSQWGVGVTYNFGRRP